jgi:hypothetical protein
VTSERYVSTRAIREAVKGRETEVLEAAGHRMTVQDMDGCRAWELFGCHRRAGWGPMQGVGLVLLLRADEIAALTATEAAIRTRTGTRQTYLGKPCGALDVAERCLLRELS